MGKKKKATTISDDVTTMANTIWLAGLGALATTQEEGSKLFKKLVKKGENVEAKGKEEVEEQLSKARGTVGRAKDQVEETVGRARQAVSGAFDDVASTFDDQLSAALHRVGVPTRDEIKTLTERVEALMEKVDKAAAAKATKPAPRRRSTASKTASSKTVAAKPAASKSTAAKPAAKKTTTRKKPAAKSAASTSKTSAKS